MSNHIEKITTQLCTAGIIILGTEVRNGSKQTKIKSKENNCKTHRVKDDILCYQVRLGEDTVQHDLMTEIQNYDDRLKEKDQTIDKLKQRINIHFHLVHELQNMNEMFNNLKKEQIDVADSDNLSVKERIRHESFDVPNINESLEPETMSEFVQVNKLRK